MEVGRRKLLIKCRFACKAYMCERSGRARLANSRDPDAVKDPARKLQGQGQEQEQEHLSTVKHNVCSVYVYVITGGDGGPE